MIEPVNGPRPPPCRSSRLRRVLVVSTWSLVFVTLVGFLGSFWWVFDLFANVRSQLTLALLGLAVALALLRAPRVALAALVGALLNLALVWPLLTAVGEPAPEPSSATLDVTFFNTKIRSDLEGVVNHLEQRDDDVIVLTATTGRWVEALDGADLDLHVVSGTHMNPGLEILVLARDPDARVIVHRLTAEDRDTVVEVVVALDGQPVHVIGTHAVSPQTPRRAARRDLVMEWIGLWPDQREGPAVVVGDLNATPWSAPFRSMLEEGGLADSQRTHGLQPSWPAGLGPLGLPIDHVLHTSDLVTLERELGPSFGSDHRMVHARLARRADAR